MIVVAVATSQIAGFFQVEVSPLALDMDDNGLAWGKAEDAERTVDVWMRSHTLRKDTDRHVG